MEPSKLKSILEKHATWLRGEGIGERADLSGANLSRADLSRADLSRADLSGADLFGADLSWANLSRADLSRADLSGADLFGADLSRADLFGANLSRADLSGADLFGANLSRADLSGADLFGADLSWANLFGADLSGANLSRADLSRANLSRARGIVSELINPYLILADQPAELIAYKLVNQKDEGIYKGGLVYTDGKELSVSDADTDANQECGAGINIATLDWILKEYKPEFKVKLVHFCAKDIAVIPTACDGKFRLHRCVVGTKEENEKVNNRVVGIIEKMKKDREEALKEINTEKVA